MADSDSFITLVLHTPERAARLREILEYHGVKVVVDDFHAPSDVQVPDVKEVRIPVESLEIGLKILESGQLVSSPVSLMKMTGMGNNLLIPVDFSPASMLAVRIGFALAAKFKVEPIVLHSYIAPVFPSEPFGEDVENPGMPEMEEEMESNEVLYGLAASQLAKFKQQILKAQKEGSVVDIHFSTSLLEGIPEQVINEYCKQNNPVMVVMATRGIHKKESDLVGSVTAEVIDSCRVPVFTVPEDCHVINMAKMKNILFFCTLSPVDMVNMRGLMKIGDYPAANVFLLPVSDRPFENVNTRIDDLAHIFTQTYPTAAFSPGALPKGKFEETMREFLEENRIDLIIVPNKKSSAFSRFFRPTLAHRILFDKDIPLLVLPV